LAEHDKAVHWCRCDSIRNVWSWQCQYVLRHVGLTETSQIGYQEKNSQTV